VVGDSVIVLIEEHIAHVVLNYPGTGNIVSQKLAYKLKDVCAKINQNEEIYVVVVTGAGEVFCDGSELEKLLIQSNREEHTVRALINDFSVARSVAGIDRPVIAAINGNAIGQGLELALACDIRYASDTAHFGLPQVSQGLIPMDGGTQRLARLIGRSQAMELIFTAKMIDSKEALSIGLINKLVNKKALKSEVEALAKLIATKGPVALKFAKEAINRGLKLSLWDGLSLETDLYSLLQTTEDRQEGIQAFLEKRQPRFRGR
jgi:enoyl-CoA hydratase